MRDTEETQQPQQAGNTRAAHQQVEGIQGERTGRQLIRAEPPSWRNQNKWKIVNIIIYKRQVTQKLNSPMKKQKQQLGFEHQT